MNLLNLVVKIGVEDEASDKVESLGSKMKTGLATAGKIAAKGVGLVTGAAAAAGGALLALEANTEGYRIAQGKLNTAFEAAGFSADSAQTAYKEFYKILGDTDTATEASQLLAKLSQSEEDVTKWTKISAGVFGTFGDSLPIEGLIESANETARTGTVTGNLADALNWVSISEDEFNAALAACGDESERNQLIMQTLSDEYSSASDAFYEANDAIVDAREVQADMDSALADLGGTISDVKTKILQDFVPGLADAAEAFSGVLQGTAGAKQAFSDSISGLIEGIADKLPQFLDMGLEIVKSLASGLLEAAPAIITAGFDVLSGIVEAIPDVVADLVENLPQIIGAIASGLVDTTGAILRATKELFSPIGDEIRAAREKLDEAAAGVTAFSDAVRDAAPNLSDINSLLSDSGNTLGELDQQIQTEIDAVSTLFASALEDGREFRAEELIDIEEHMENIRELQAEQLEIARSQQIAVLRATENEKNTITQESSAQLIANINAAYAESNRLAEESYYTELTLIENKYKARGMIGSTSHQQELDAAKAHYDSMLAENSSYYTESLEQIGEGAAAWLETDREKFAKIAELNQAWILDSDNAFTTMAKKFGDFLGLTDAWGMSYGAALDTAALDNANAFLTMAADVKNSGGQIDEEMANIINVILGAFDNLPENLQEEGRAAIEGIIAGLDETIPGLENPAEMSVQEIVNTIRDGLDINSPSKVMEGIGKNIIQGLINGMSSLVSSVVSKAKSIASSVINTIKSTLGIRSPSKVMMRLGEYTAEGFSMGWDNEINKLKSHIGLDMGEISSHSYISGNSSSGQTGAVTVIQNIYSSEKTAADLMQEAKWQQDKAVMGLV